MKNDVFCDVAPRGFVVNRRFGASRRLNLEDCKILQEGNQRKAGSKHSSELVSCVTSRPTRRDSSAPQGSTGIATQWACETAMRHQLAAVACRIKCPHSVFLRFAFLILFPHVRPGSHHETALLTHVPRLWVHTARCLVSSRGWILISSLISMIGSTRSSAIRD
jgi:hypothetical protein